MGKQIYHEQFHTPVPWLMLQMCSTLRSRCFIGVREVGEIRSLRLHMNDIVNV